jgi:hypothetical protein
MNRPETPDREWYVGAAMRFVDDGKWEMAEAWFQWTSDTLFLPHEAKKPLDTLHKVFANYVADLLDGKQPGEDVQEGLKRAAIFYGAGAPLYPRFDLKALVPEFQDERRTKAAGKGAGAFLMSSFLTYFPQAHGQRASIWLRSCELCNRAFLVRVPKARFCSGKCRTASHRNRPASKTHAPWGAAVAR